MNLKDKDEDFGCHPSLSRQQKPLKEIGGKQFMVKFVCFSSQCCTYCLPNSEHVTRQCAFTLKTSYLRRHFTTSASVVRMSCRLPVPASITLLQLPTISSECLHSVSTACWKTPKMIQKASLYMNKKTQCFTRYAASGRLQQNRLTDHLRNFHSCSCHQNLAKSVPVVQTCLPRPFELPLDRLIGLHIQHNNLHANTLRKVYYNIYF